MYGTAQHLGGIDAPSLPWRNMITEFSDITVKYTGWPKKLHISICLMLNWYSFMETQPNMIIFLADLHLNRFPTKQCIHCPQHLLRVFTLPCRNNIVRFLCCLKMKFAYELCWKTTKQCQSHKTVGYWSVYKQCSICTDERDMPVCRAISRGLRWLCVVSSWLQISSLTISTFSVVRADFGRPLPGFLAAVPSKSIFLIR